MFQPPAMLSFYDSHLPSLPPSLDQAWVGHPYFDIVDNSTDFENKIRRVIEAVCRRLGDRVGVDIDERLQAQSRKRKFLIRTVPDIKVSWSSFLH